MQPISLRINTEVYKHLIWFLKRFSKDEIEVVEETYQFLLV